VADPEDRKELGSDETFRRLRPNFQQVIARRILKDVERWELEQVRVEQMRSRVGVDFQDPGEDYPDRLPLD
jgi:hypothetical protein